MRYISITGDYLVEVIINFKVCKVLEIGTLVGHSSILMAAHLPENGIVHTIEINPEAAKLALQNIQSANMDHKIKVHVGDALKTIPGIDEEFDLFYIDGKKSDYLKYLKVGENKLKKNSLVIADNVKRFESDMQDYLEYVRNSGMYDSKYFDFGFDGIEISTILF